ncbi:MAG: hypothetical protein U0T75_09670 [Chitinophagales bacterium]
MKAEEIKFIVIMLVTTLVLGGLQLVWNQQASAENQLHNGIPLLTIIAVAVTLVHIFLVRSSHGDPKAFVTKFMAASGLKLMLYLLVLVAFLLFETGNKKILVIHFLGYYAVYTIIEVSLLYSTLQQSKKK